MYALIAIWSGYNKSVAITLHRYHHIAMEKILSNRQSTQRKNMHIPWNNNKIQLCHLDNHTIHIRKHYHAYD